MRLLCMCLFASCIYSNFLFCMKQMNSNPGTGKEHLFILIFLWRCSLLLGVSCKPHRQTQIKCYNAFNASCRGDDMVSSAGAICHQRVPLHGTLQHLPYLPPPVDMPLPESIQHVWWKPNSTTFATWDQHLCLHYISFAAVCGVLFL